MRRAILLLLAGAGLALVLLPGAAAASPGPVRVVVQAPGRAPVLIQRAGPPSRLVPEAPRPPVQRAGPPSRLVPEAPRPPVQRAGAPSRLVPDAPRPPTPPTKPSINLNINGTNPDGSKPASSLVIMLGLTVLSVAPALLLLCTSFTKIFMVLGITRNALGLSTMPPNQVLAGLALFLTLFVMGPTVSAVNQQGVQPYLKGDKTQSQAFQAGVKPLREFMWKTTRSDEVGLMIKLSGEKQPRNPDDVQLTTLIPAFVLSELRAAFIIGFVIFIPFLLIDMVVAASLMSLGMMMLPPVTVSLPFKLLLFVLVNGWGLILTALVASYR